MLTRKTAKTLILGSGQAKKKILRMLAKEKLPQIKGNKKAADKGTKGGNKGKKEALEEKKRLKKKLDKLDSVKDKLRQKIKDISKQKGTGKTLSVKSGGKKKESFKNKGGKKGDKKQQRSGKGDGKRGKRPTEDALDKELETYWIKKGEKGTVQNHLDSEMDAYWKTADKSKDVAGVGSEKIACNINEQTASNSVDGSMLLSMNDLPQKDMTGASPHYSTGLNIISN